MSDTPNFPTDQSELESIVREVCEMLAAQISNTPAHGKSVGEIGPWLRGAFIPATEEQIEGVASSGCGRVIRELAELAYSRQGPWGAKRMANVAVGVFLHSGMVYRLRSLDREIELQKDVATWKDSKRAPEKLEATFPKQPLCYWLPIANPLNAPAYGSGSMATNDSEMLSDTAWAFFNSGIRHEDYEFLLVRILISASFFNAVLLMRLNPQYSGMEESYLDGVLREWAYHSTLGKQPGYRNRLRLVRFLRLAIGCAVWGGLLGLVWRGAASKPDNVWWSGIVGLSAFVSYCTLRFFARQFAAWVRPSRCDEFASISNQHVRAVVRLRDLFFLVNARSVSLLVLRESLSLAHAEGACISQAVASLLDRAIGSGAKSWTMRDEWRF